MFNKFNLLVLTLFTVLIEWEGAVNGEIVFKKGSPQVKLANNGVISGKLLYSREGRPFIGFQGIPFATIPERFAEAELITQTTWEGIKEAVQMGPMCPQIQNIGPPIDENVFNEDCLNLNVYVPMNNTGKRGYPVMVYIHPGGFTTGGGYIWGPHFALEEDVILVTINYRLGAFGFLSTGDEIIPGNNGLKDMVVALRWVQENIKNFAGDAGRVTIFGTSAGGAAVHYLLLSPTAKGLFHRAISQSATAYHHWAYQPNPKELAVQLATHMKCPTTAGDSSGISSQEILTCLKKATWKDLIKAHADFKPSWPMNYASFFFSPTHEPESLSGKSQLTPFITKSPFAILKDKTIPINEVPWIVGCTVDEGASTFSAVVLHDEKLLNELDQSWNDVAPAAFGFDKWVPKSDFSAISDKIREFYFGSKPISLDTRDQITDLYSDSMFTHGIYKAALETAAKGKRNPVWVYQYAHATPISLLGMMLPADAQELTKTGHGDDLLMQFDMGKMMTGETIFVQPDSPDEQFSKNFVKLWTSFAIHGEPKYSWGNSVARKWKPITREESEGKVPLKFYRLDDNPQQIENPYKDRIMFHDKLFKEHFEARLLSPSTPTKQGSKNKSEL